MLLGIRRSRLLMSQRCTSYGKHKRAKIRRTISNRIKRLKTEMEEISEDQKRIREEQKQLRQKFEQTEMVCEQLRRETYIITQQSVNNDLQLRLMFQILKAREAKHLSKDAALTHILREMIAKQSKEIGYKL